MDIIINKPTLGSRECADLMIKMRLKLYKITPTILNAYREVSAILRGIKIANQPKSIALNRHHEIHKK